MKKFLVLVLLFACVSANAQHRAYYPHGYYRPYHDHLHWVLPAVVGGVVVYEMTKPPVIVQQPVVIQPPLELNCSPWREIQTPDGKIYRERTCTQ
jgi:hypothetical protein